MSAQYDFSIKSTEDQLPVDAGTDGWDFLIQGNNVAVRRYAAQTPNSLIVRQVDFNGDGLGMSDGTQFTLFSLGVTGSSLNNFMIIPTMVGLMVAPQSHGVMATTFSGYLAASNSALGGSSPSHRRAITPIFSLVPGLAPLTSANNSAGGIPMEDSLGTTQFAKTPTMISSASTSASTAGQGQNWISAAFSSSTFTASNHGLAVNTIVQVHLGPSLQMPNGFAANTNYYVRNQSADTFQLAQASTGAVLTFGNAGTVLVADMAKNFAGYYYLCPVHMGWWPTYGANACGGVPMRGINLGRRAGLNNNDSPFGMNPAADNSQIRYTTPNTTSSIFDTISLMPVFGGGLMTCKFSVVDLYGMIIPSSS